MLREAMSFIHIPTLDRFVDDLGTGYISKRIFTLHTAFAETVSSSLFHIYDCDLAQKVSSFQISWNASLNFGSYFYPAGDNYSFHNTGTPAQAAAWENVLVTAEELRTATRELLQHIREHYMEVNLTQTSAAAWAGLLEIDDAVKVALTRRSTSTPKKAESLNSKIKRSSQQSLEPTARRRK
jgi:hypothetical protein